jgi:putative membrane protein
MKKISLMILSGAAALSMIGCGDGAATNTTVVANANSKMANATSNAIVVVNSNTANANGKIVDTIDKSASSTATTPEGFMTEAAKGGMAEVELSKMALPKLKDAAVKQFAQQMISEHTRANNELKALAAKKKVTLPTELDADHKATAADMNSMSGADFDKDYVNAMVADHEKSVALFQSQASSGTDADAKAFAAKTLPTLQKHLDAIKAIQGKMK